MTKACQVFKPSLTLPMQFSGINQMKF